MRRVRPRGIHHYRRWSQIASLTLFFALLTLTVWPLGQVYLGAFLLADPLIAANSLAAGVWKWPMLLAALMLALPLVAGRAWCGYACPLGTIVELTGPKDFGRSALSAPWRDRLRRLPVFVLLFSAGLLLFASGAFLFLDPLALLTRAATTLVYPLVDRFLRLAGDVFYLVPPLRGGVDAATSALAGRLLFPEPLVYGLQLLVLGALVAILGASWLEPRLWCRDVCPLGALLGQVSRFAPVGRAVDADACISCDRCRNVCPLDAVGEDYRTTDATRCQLGLECADVCPTAAIGLGRRTGRVTYDPSRRGLVTGAGLALVTGFFVFTGARRARPHPRLVRPPGAREEKGVLALCSRCGQCMKVCPTNVIQPALSKTGVEGLFTPEMDFRTGSCDWSCNECGKVCPTGALEPLALDAKRRTVIGRAYIDKDRCIPWADARTCLVCQELCPVPEKAVVIDEAEVPAPDGGRAVIGRPQVVPDRCIGCGVCENVCPVPREAAIVVEASRR